MNDKSPSDQHASQIPHSLDDTSRGGKTLREAVSDALREAIIRGELGPGMRLQEIEIAEHYRTSRTPVREAFRQLESEGFLVIKPRRGAIVAPITSSDIREFYEIKSVLEGYAAGRAATRITQQEIARMEFLNQELRTKYEGGDISGMIKAHNEFHEVFVQASGNDQLCQLIKSLVNRFQRFRIALSHTPAIERSVKQHEEIIQAFREKNSELARELVAKNSMDGSEALMSQLRVAA